MTKIFGALTAAQALVAGLAILGCATAALLTNHLTSTDFLGVLAGLGFISAPIATAHVVGTQVNAAANASTPTVTTTAVPATVTTV